MANTKIEQFTEELTQKQMNFHLGENLFGYVHPQGNIHNITKIKEHLSKAGGKPKECNLDDFSSGGNGRAKPEFVITFNDDTNTIIVIECKKNAKDHASENLNQPNKYAVDGALYYSKFLKEEYNVIIIAISGTEKDKTLLDVYFWNKGHEEAILQKKLHNIFLTPENYLKAYKGEKISKSYSLDEIRETAIDFHNKLREIKITERQKPVFIAGILIALEDREFSQDYISFTSFKTVINNLITSIQIVLEDKISKQKLDSIKSSFKVIETNEKLKNIPLNQNGSITWYIEQLEMKIKPMMNNADSSLDALGVFYHEFVKYSGGDGSGLGIVLTPQHLTEFMCELAEVDENSYVVDICCGSASFLVSAMNTMFKKTSDPDKYKNIREHQLHGIEFDADLYLLSITNMIIRKDGKSNIIHGDCFNKEKIKMLHEASKKRNVRDGETIRVLNNNAGLNVGLLNPPYSQKDIEELEFVEQLLSILVKGGRAVVVVPMSCAIGTKYKDSRKRLFEKHTLKAVFSMPDDVFYPTGTNVCIMVWEAHKPHDIRTKTYFGYYKEDGFVKRKKVGRVDAYEKWEDIKSNWIQLYKDSDVIAGVSAKQNVNDTDEWLAEAYMKTDYSILEDEMFEVKIREYLAYLITYGINDLNTINPYKKEKIELNSVEWKDFDLSDLFIPKRGTRLKQEDRIKGNIPLVTAGEGNLGVKDLISNEEQEVYEKRITIDMFCNSYIHIDPFCCDDNIITLQPREDISKYTMLFLSTMIEQDKYRYQYGRQYRMKNFNKHIVKLPTTNGKNPDYDFMDNYIKSLPYSEYI